jgi:hypothetical protein
MNDLREFYLETIQSTRHTLTTILNILQRQEDTLASLVDSARDELIQNNQIPMQQTRSGSINQSSAPGIRRSRSLFERNGTSPITARTQVQRRRIFNNSTGEPHAQAIHTAAAGPAPSLFSIPDIASGASATANNRETNIGAILAAALMSEMGASLSPVIVRPSARQIEATTELIPYSDISENNRIEECPISREPFSETSAVMRIRHCRHYFAPESLRTWFNSSVRCPICRHDIRSTLSENLANDHRVDEYELENDDDDVETELENEETSNTLQTSSEPSQPTIPSVTTSSSSTNSTFMNPDGTTSFISTNPLGDLMNIIRDDAQNDNNTSLTYTIDFTPYFNDISGNMRY